jgi:hypothetical protein
VGHCLEQCYPAFLCTRAQFTDAYGRAGATTLLLLLLLLLLNTTISTTSLYTITTTTTNNNKIIRNLILTKSFLNIIIFTYNLT